MCAKKCINNKFGYWDINNFVLIAKLLVNNCSNSSIAARFDFFSAKQLKARIVSLDLHMCILIKRLSHCQLSKSF